MWWRFFIFCVLVSFIIFVVMTAIYGKPVIHLFFHRCCGDDIENDQVIFENFGNNLKERLIGGDIIEADNNTQFQVNIERIDDMKEVLSINDPEVKKWLNSDVPDTITEDGDNKEGNSVTEKERDDNETVTNKYELLEEVEETTETDSSRELLNVHNQKHKRMIGSL